MTTISDINGPGSTATELAGAQEMGQDTFLKLLTTQMQNQDPMSPQSSEAFVEQLATFSSLEQLMGIQSSLEAVYMGIASMNNASMAGLLGAEVVAVGDTFAYEGEGEVELHYFAADGASSGELVVRDENDKVIYSQDLGALSEGDGTLTWDGTNHDGQPVGEGEYSFSITATDRDGESVEVEERVAGTITEMDYSSGSPQPSLDGIIVDLADIIRLTTSGED